MIFLHGYFTTTKLLGQNQWTALMFASRNGRVEIVKLLLAHPGVDANMRNKVNQNVGRAFVPAKKCVDCMWFAFY